jgi:hypothetical protein
MALKTYEYTSIGDENPGKVMKEDSRGILVFNCSQVSFIPHQEFTIIRHNIILFLVFNCRYSWMLRLNLVTLKSRASNDLVCITRMSRNVSVIPKRWVTTHGSSVFCQIYLLLSHYLAWATHYFSIYDCETFWSVSNDGNVGWHLT